LPIVRFSKGHNFSELDLLPSLGGNERGISPVSSWFKMHHFHINTQNCTQFKICTTYNCSKYLIIEIRTVKRAGDKNKTKKKKFDNSLLIVKERLETQVYVGTCPYLHFSQTDKSMQLLLHE
jgi:hypothetical protein